MFTNIRHRLLFSYILIFASVLIIFALGFRWFFAYSLKQELIDKLIALGQGLAASAEWENDRLTIENDFKFPELLDKNQSLQWFNSQGQLLLQQGNTLIYLPLSPQKISRFQQGKRKIQIITLPIIDLSNNNKLIGYLRVSQSLEEIDATLEKLDLGLGIGILLALGFSGVGGIMLTNQAMKPIEESFQRLKQFTADASHEFRSPLMAIESNVDVSLKYSEGMRESDRESFEAIASATHQMIDLTQDLLLLARTEKTHNFRPDRVNLKTVIENLLKLYTYQLIAKNIQVELEFKEAIFVFGDAGQLPRLFGNLIENALYYTPEGGLIEIQGKRQGSLVEIKVKDTGIGIAAEHLDRVFERFWRADTSRSYWQGGSGLGLSIVKAIAENHGGTITVTSQLGIGSCFTVKLSAPIPGADSG